RSFSLTSDRGLLHVFRRRQHFLCAISQAVHLFCRGWPLLISIERRIDPSQGRLQRNARIFPSLNQRPIKSGQQQATGAALLEALFDLSEVIEVIFNEIQRREFELVSGVGVLSGALARAEDDDVATAS